MKMLVPVEMAQGNFCFKKNADLGIHLSPDLIFQVRNILLQQKLSGRSFAQKAPLFLQAGANPGKSACPRTGSDEARSKLPRISPCRIACRASSVAGPLG